jgi:hypothetical protein
MAALEFNAVDNVGPVEWSVNYGAMDPGTGDMSVLSPLNLTRTVKHGGPVIVTAKDTGTDPWTEATFTLEIEGTLPVVCDWDVESDINLGAELSEPEKGDPKFRVMERSAQFPLTFQVHQYLDYAGARDFLIAHETLPFWVEDPSIGELSKGYCVSALRRVPHRTNLLAYSFQFKVFGYVPPANIADIGPWAP